MFFRTADYVYESDTCHGAWSFELKFLCETEPTARAACAVVPCGACDRCALV